MMSRIRFLLAAVVLPTGLLASPTASPGGFIAGEWEHKTQLVSAEVPGIPQWLIRVVAGRGSRRNCTSPAMARQHPEALLQGDQSATCKLRKLSMANGRLVFDTFCTNARFPQGLLVSSRGTYTPTSYSISTTSTGTKNGRPVRIVTTGTGKHVADACGKT